MEVPLSGEGNQKILSHVSFPREGVTSHSLRVAESRASIVERLRPPSIPSHTEGKGAPLPRTCFREPEYPTSNRS